MSSDRKRPRCRVNGAGLSVAKARICARAESHQTARQALMSTEFASKLVQQDDDNIKLIHMKAEGW